MYRIFFFARDPGGSNVIIPMIKRFLKEKINDVIVYAKDVAYGRMQREGIDCIDIQTVLDDITYDNVLNLLGEINPNAVITGTSLNDYTERYLWKAASELGIYSCTVLDQWVNLGVRFSKYDYTGLPEYNREHIHPYLPSRIIAMDEYAKQMIINDGIASSLIKVCGSPYFDTVRDKFKFAPINGHDSDNDREIIFVSEPISEDYDHSCMESMYWGYNEFTAFEYLYGCVEKLAVNSKKRIHITVRPHPRENENNWINIVSKLTSANVDVKVDKFTDGFILMKDADVVCGMSSMFLLEAAICQVPIISIQIDLTKENPFILDKIGVCKSKTSVTELYDALNEKLLSNEEMKVHFPIIKNATERVVLCIEEDLNYGCTGN